MSSKSLMVSGVILILIAAASYFIFCGSSKTIFEVTDVRVEQREEDLHTIYVAVLSHDSKTTRIHVHILIRGHEFYETRPYLVVSELFINPEESVTVSMNVTMSSLSLSQIRVYVLNKALWDGKDQ